MSRALITVGADLLRLRNDLQVRAAEDKLNGNRAHGMEHAAKQINVVLDKIIAARNAAGPARPRKRRVRVRAGGRS